MNRKLVLIGASGHGKVCADIAELCGYRDIVFLDDDSSLKKCGKYPVIGTSEMASDYINKDADFFVTIGNHVHRRRVQESIIYQKGRVVTLIHPDAVISKEAAIKQGTVVMAGAVVNPYAEVGDGCIINTCSSVDHDCKVGAYSHVAVGAHLCGTVEIGENVWIGAGATVSNNVSVCQDVIVGAGTVVVRNIKESGTYVGIPAKRIK